MKSLAIAAIAAYAVWILFFSPHCLRCEYWMNEPGHVKVVGGKVVIEKMPITSGTTVLFTPTYYFEGLRAPFSDFVCPRQVYLNKIEGYVDCNKDIPPPSRLLRISGYIYGWSAGMCVITANATDCIKTPMLRTGRVTLYYDLDGRRFIYDDIPAACRPLGAVRGESITKSGIIRLPVEVELNVGNYTLRAYATNIIMKHPYAEVNIAVEECIAG